MADPIYKKITVVGSSEQSFEDAIANAVAHCAETEKSMSWFEVVEQRGHIAEGKVQQYQVAVTVGIRVG